TLPEAAAPAPPPHPPPRPRARGGHLDALCARPRGGRGYRTRRRRWRRVPSDYPAESISSPGAEFLSGVMIGAARDAIPIQAGRLAVPAKVAGDRRDRSALHAEPGCLHTFPCEHARGSLSCGITPQATGTHSSWRTLAATAGSRWSCNVQVGGGQTAAVNVVWPGQRYGKWCTIANTSGSSIPSTRW